MAGDFVLKNIKVCNTEIEMLTGGSGDPLLILHGTDGSLGWLNYAKEPVSYTHLRAHET